VTVAAVRNVAIILLLAAAVAFVPGGGDTAAVVGAVLSTLILASFVALGARFYRERRLDIEGLGDPWRGLLYAAIAVVVFALAGRERMLETGAGTAVWFALLLGAAYAGYRVWRHWREYA
jgi:hypothetical protein